MTSGHPVRVRLSRAADTARRNAPYRSGGGDAAQTKTKTSAKDKALYKRLRNLGVSVKESTRVANASARASRRKTGQHGGAATSCEDGKVPRLQRKGQEGWHQRPGSYEQKQLIKAPRRLRAPAISHPADSGPLALPERGRVRRFIKETNNGPATGRHR